MDGGHSVPSGVVVYILDPWTGFWEQWLTGGNQPAYMVECCWTKVTSDALGGRDDLVEFLTLVSVPNGPLWLPIEANRNSSNGSLGGMPPSAWRLKLDIYRAAVRQDFAPNAGFAMSLLDQLLIQQIRHNVKVLRVHRWKPVMIQLIQSVLSLHLGEFVFREMRLMDFAFDGDEGFDIFLENHPPQHFTVLDLLHDPTFRFDVQFADEERFFARESSDNLLLGPRDRRMLRSQVCRLRPIPDCSEQVVDLDFNQLMTNIVAMEEWRPRWQYETLEVARACDIEEPSSVILKTDLWRFMIKWHHLSRTDGCPAYVGMAQEKLRFCLINSLDEGVEKLWINQIILNILGLSIGCKVFSENGRAIGVSNGHLRHVSCKNDKMAVLYLEYGDGRLILLTAPLEQIPFLWQSGRFVVRVDPNLILPNGWFRPSGEVAA